MEDTNFLKCSSRPNTVKKEIHWDCIPILSKLELSFSTFQERRLDLEGRSVGALGQMSIGTLTPQCPISPMPSSISKR